MKRRTKRRAHKGKRPARETDDGAKSSKPVPVSIERLSAEGQGLGRLNPGKESRGRVIFVPYTAPGDEIDAAVTGMKQGYARGRIANLRKSGPGRIEPRCPLHFTPARPSLPCGGCGWQHLSPAAQAEAKREIVRDCLFRIAKAREPRVEPTLASPEAWRYRNKVLVPFGKSPRGVTAGFFAPGSHRIVDFEDCFVQPELSVRMTLKVKRLAAEFGWKVYDEDRHAGWLRHLFIRTNRKGRALAALITRTPSFPDRERFTTEMRKTFPELTSLFHNIQPLRTSVVLGRAWNKLWGTQRLEERVGRVRLRLSPESFLQVNTPAGEVLYAVVERFLSAGGFRPRVALDLYCGAGAIALWIAPRCGKVLGLEENRTAVADAWDNARLNGASNVRFQAGPVESLLGRVRSELDSIPPDTAAAVLDPPRGGCDRAVLKALRERALKRIVYVSCNPASFARDADRLMRMRWRLKKVQPVDLFPQTSHVELAALFERN